MDVNSPLVSIVILTYNSSEFILETLESAKKQTYRNLELIVTDDCSTDNTVKVCRKWFSENEDRFVRTKLLTTDKNTGVSANCNRGYKEAQGEWIKGIGGDDLLPPYSIQNYIAFITKETKCNICLGKLIFFGKNEALVEKNEKTYERAYYPYLRMEWKRQYKKILKSLFVPGPGIFVKKALWTEVGGYDERYPFCEEYPFTYNVIAKGEKVFFIEEGLILYRIREGSLCRDELGMNKRVFHDYRQYFIDCRRKNMIKHGYILQAFHETIYLFNLSLRYSPSSKNSPAILLGKCLFFLSPLFYYLKSKKLLNKH